MTDISRDRRERFTREVIEMFKADFPVSDDKAYSGTHCVCIVFHDGNASIASTTDKESTLEICNVAQLLISERMVKN